jgi:hypothetical protein
VTGTATTRKRQANELIRDRLRGGSDDEPIAFFCECGSERCYRAVWLTGREYDGGRTDRTWAVLIRGHRASAREDEGAPTVEGEAGVVAPEHPTPPMAS